jgi:hypothetical protein
MNLTPILGPAQLLIQWKKGPFSADEVAGEWSSGQEYVELKLHCPTCLRGVDGATLLLPIQRAIQMLVFLTLIVVYFIRGFQNHFSRIVLP